MNKIKRKKMSRAAFVDMFPLPYPTDGDPDPRVKSKATSKGHKHQPGKHAIPSHGPRAALYRQRTHRNVMAQKRINRETQLRERAAARIKKGKDHG